MTWSKEAPTRDGWYWRRHPGDTPGAPCWFNSKGDWYDPKGEWGPRIPEPLEWTADLPKTPGHFGWRESNDAEPIFVDVKEYPEGLIIYFEGVGLRSGLISRVGGLWYGPVMLPWESPASEEANGPA